MRTEEFDRLKTGDRILVTVECIVAKRDREFVRIYPLEPWPERLSDRDVDRVEKKVIVDI